MDRLELDDALNNIQRELYDIVRKHALDIPDEAVEEIAVYFLLGKIPSVNDWKSK